MRTDGDDDGDLEHHRDDGRLGWQRDDDGGDAVTARGVCWSTSESPTTADSKTTDGTGTGEFTSSITGLSRRHDVLCPGVRHERRRHELWQPSLIHGGFGTDGDVTNVTDDGGDAVTGTSESPTIADSKTTDGEPVSSPAVSPT